MGQFLKIILVLAALIITGTLGFHLVEGWSLFDSLYMTVITLTTVGYSEVNGLSSAGRVFTMIFLTAGLGAFLYGLTQLGDAVVHAQFSDWLGKRRRDTTVKHLKDHFIVCGFGRLGRSLCEELAARKLDFVVVEKNVDALERCQQAQWAYLVADATEDRSLLEAGVERARGLATVLSSDAENLYVVLSARLLSKKVQILTRASTEKDAEKLKRAGADRVISLYAAGAAKMAQLLSNPNVEDFIEIITAKGRQLDLTEIVVTAQAAYAGKKLSETDFRERGIIIVAIRRKSGELSLPPKGSDVLEPGDCLIALGKAEAIESLIRTG